MNVPSNKRFETFLLVIKDRQMPIPGISQSGPCRHARYQPFPAVRIAHSHHTLDPLEPLAKLILRTHRFAEARFIREIVQVHSHARREATVVWEFGSCSRRSEISQRIART